MKKLSYREYIVLKRFIEAIEAVDDLPEYCHGNTAEEEEVEYFHLIQCHMPPSATNLRRDTL
jgi:hypothetical protein